MNQSIIEIFKRLNLALLSIDVKTETRLEEFLLRRAAIHRFEEPEYLRILFFILSQIDEKGEFTSALEAFHLPKRGNEGKKEIKNRLTVYLENLRRMGVLKIQWIGERSLSIDGREFVKAFSFAPSGMDIFKKLNSILSSMDPEFLKRFYELVFRRLRFQQFGLIECARIFFHILSIADERGKAKITEKALFEAVSRTDKKGDLVPGEFRIKLFLDEMGRRKAFSIYRGQDLQIEVSEVINFLSGWHSIIPMPPIFKEE